MSKASPCHNVIITSKEALTHWGQVTHISVSKLTIIGSDNDLAPGRRQAIIWTNAGILLIQYLGKKLLCNLKQNSYIFIQENICESVVCEMAAIFSLPQYISQWGSLCRRNGKIWSYWRLSIWQSSVSSKFSIDAQQSTWQPFHFIDSTICKYQVN